MIELHKRDVGLQLVLTDLKQNDKNRYTTVQQEELGKSISDLDTIKEEVKHIVTIKKSVNDEKLTQADIDDMYDKINTHFLNMNETLKNCSSLCSQVRTMRGVGASSATQRSA